MGVILIVLAIIVAGYLVLILLPPAKPKEGKPEEKLFFEEELSANLWVPELHNRQVGWVILKRGEKPDEHSVKAPVFETELEYTPVEGWSPGGS